MSTTNPFKQASAKISIGSKDDASLTVEAQYNPKELQVDQTVPWKKQDATNKSGIKEDEKKTDNSMALEFTGAEGRTMTVEMLFDQFEPNAKDSRKVDVLKKLADLQTMAQIRIPTSTKEEERRPHHCIVKWGDKGLPRFDCVIESLSIKYTMFDSDGTPLRATATVKLKEALIVDKVADANKPNQGSGKK